MSNISGPSYTHSGLANGSTYYYTVSATNAFGETDLSYAVSAAFDTLPPRITSVSPSPGGSTTVSTWNRSINVQFTTSEPIYQGYIPLVVKDGNGNVIPLTSPATWSGMDQAFHATFIGDYDSTYSATLAAGITDLAGNHLASDYTWSFSSRPLEAPYAVATPGDNQVTLFWQNAGAPASNVYWSTTPGVTKATGIKIVGAVSPFIFTGLPADTPCYFVVTNVSGNIESADSAEVNSLGLMPPATMYTETSPDTETTAASESK